MNKKVIILKKHLIIQVQSIILLIINHREVVANLLKKHLKMKIKAKRMLTITITLMKIYLMI